MTWTLFDTISGGGGNFFTGRMINNFEDDFLFISTSSTDLYQYVVGGADSKIGDASDEDIAQSDGPYPVLLNGTDLYQVGSGGTPVLRKCISYDGTPLSWTDLGDLTTNADTSGRNDFFATPTPNRATMVAHLGLVFADGGLEEVASSSNGSAWTLVSLLSSATGRSIGNPVTVAGDDTYGVVRNASSEYQFAAFNGGSWSLNAATYAAVTYFPLVHWWIDQEQSGSGFSGLWLDRLADAVAMRSTNGGTSFTVTQTTDPVDFVLAQTDIFSVNGLEFARSTLGGINRLWYFNGLVWQQVDSTVLPQAGDIAGVFFRDTTLYLLQGNDIYTTDEFVFAAANTYTAAAIPKPCSIDADGTYIYIAALSSGNPVLIKFATALNADGSTVFTPGSGSDIGVECSLSNPDVVWVAGAFDGTNVVERSTNAGASFVVEDPGTFDAVTAFDVGPDTDERVLVVTETTGSIGLVSIEETLTGGDSWTENNAGLSSPGSVTALDRLDINPDEVVLGGVNATERADYSPNAGVDLDNITSGSPTSDITTVIVGVVG